MIATDGCASASRLSAGAQAEPVQPGRACRRQPGQYTGYPDWLAKQSFTKAGMPDDVVNEYVQCAYKALLRHHDAARTRHARPGGARTNGMTAKELRAFERAVADRMDDGDATDHIVTTCKAPYERFLGRRRGRGRAGGLTA